jgi:hypothetical protein
MPHEEAVAVRERLLGVGFADVVVLDVAAPAPEAAPAEHAVAA